MLLLLYAVAVGITPEFTFLGVPKVRITDLLLPLLFLFGSRVAARGQTKQPPLPLAGLFWIIFFWNLGALFVWGEASTTPGLFYLAKRFLYFLTAYSASRAVRDVASWNRVIRLLVFTSPLLSFTVLRELSHNIDAGGILASSEGMRASGIIANQQTSTALYIVAITCLALGAWDAFKDTAWKIGSLISVGAGCMAVFATGSRGAFACVVLGVLCTMLQRPKQGCSLLVLSLAIGGVSWIVTPTELQTRLAGIVSETSATWEDLSEGNRLDVGGSSIADRAMAFQDAFRYYIPKAGMMGLGAGFKNLGAVDDFYLTEWIYHGFLGLALFVGLQIGVAKGLLHVRRNAVDPVERGVASGVLTAWIVLSASGVHADTFYLIRPMEAMMLMLGLVAARRAIRLCESST